MAQRGRALAGSALDRATLLPVFMAHFLVDHRPELVADRALRFFAQEPGRTTAGW